MDATQRKLPGQDRETTARQALQTAATRDYAIRLGMTSGGRNSLAAVDAAWRWGRDYGVAPEAVVHVNTGAGLEVTRETVREFAAERGLSYIEGINREPGERLAHRVHEYGWPSHGQGSREAGGHWPEYINRKERVWEGIYRSWGGDHLWYSGAFATESDRRAVTVGDAPVDFGETGDRKPRLTWCSPVHGWHDRDFEEYCERFDIPETPAYDIVGYSGDCVACSFDDPTVVNELAIINPELAWTLRSLCVWLFQRFQRGETDWGVHRCVWGWDPEIEADDGPLPEPEGRQRTMQWAGCASCEASACHQAGDSP